MKKIKIITVFGTRPEIIKLSPVISLLDECSDHILVHTGQHYSYNLDRLFFEEMHLRNPDHQLNVGSGTPAYQVGTIMMKVEEILLKERPDLVLVQGDTNSTLAGALAAVKSGIPLGHIESGYRSGNLQMAEEINRIITDRLSRYLFVGTQEGMENLHREGVEGKMFLVGNTAIDALRKNETLADEKVLVQHSLTSDGYILVTVHRAENTEEKNLSSIVNSLNKLAEMTTVVFPIHPRTRKMIETFQLSLSAKITVIESTGYLEFISLMKNAAFIMTDSGGIQEESVELNVPCLILRNETETMDLVNAGKTILTTTDKDRIFSIASSLLESKEKREEIKNRPFSGKSGVAQKIVEILLRELTS
ncbi:UDP-N-acetylglucosamine 2-epimerase (non-hydrolyzing) [Candidatus Woesearchaeota archaeon CG10_big_fil_rev_8_21_14_0_10_45_16]|nr:MAG: UDP-N-acetylglucosamine 2-epimerase (non-hydrolyzing) [Candidatus Woesearchaeota archaeon CG10_big_fil_rev_8_21_14_0_10_45_16]